MSGGGGGGNPALEEDHPAHDNHERYLLTYADMITLLLALFIVLFAIGQVDQSKFNQFRAGLASEFGNNHNLDAGTGVLPGGESVPTPISPSDGASSDIRALLEGAGVSSGGETGTGDSAPTTTTAASTTTAPVASGTEPVAVTDPVGFAGYGGHIDSSEGAALAGELAAALTAQGISVPEDARVIVDPERGVIIQLSTDDVTFATGSAALTAQGQSVLDSLVPALEAFDNEVEIDGYTDDTGGFDLNWDLSGARAATTVKYLQNAHQMAPERLHYGGYGETRPLASNETEDGRRVNRRVEVVIAIDPTIIAAPFDAGTVTPTTGTTTTPTGATQPTTPTTTRPTTPTTSTAGSGVTPTRATTGIVISPGDLARQAGG